MNKRYTLASLFLAATCAVFAITGPLNIWQNSDSDRINPKKVAQSSSTTINYYNSKGDFFTKMAKASPFIGKYGCEKSEGIKWIESDVYFQSVKKGDCTTFHNSINNIDKKAMFYNGMTAIWHDGNMKEIMLGPEGDRSILDYGENFISDPEIIEANYIIQPGESKMVTKTGTGWCITGDKLKGKLTQTNYSFMLQYFLKYDFTNTENKTSDDQLIIDCVYYAIN